MNKHIIVFATILLVVGIGASPLVRNTFPAMFAQTPVPSTVQIVSEESAVIDAVKKAAPAVVSIVATGDVPKLERCFREGLGGFGGVPFQIPSTCQNGTEKKQLNAGSGFLVTEDGYVMTNKHVVSEAEGTEYTVILNDEARKGKTVVAKVLATDPTNDIAVLKIEETGLPFLTFADSDAIQVGQTAIAIGYALGEFENSVSKGVVSGLSRSIDASGGQMRSERLSGIIQTDTAINPGNSGGPLLDIQGNVIGMNVAMASAQSIAFALPANEVRGAFESVKSTGRIDKPFLGIRYLPIDAELKRQLGLAYDYGVIVTRGDTMADLAIVPGSPADKAGIEDNDVILTWNGERIDEDAELLSFINRAKVGETVALTVSRAGEERTVSLTLTARPAN